MTEPLIDTNWEEHYIKRGDPTKPTYYIIRREQIAEGLFYRFILVAGHIKHALQNGWLPVVDMQNYPNPYIAPEKFGKENAWEYYFEQPFRIGVEQAYNGENIILGVGVDKFPRPNMSMAFLEGKLVSFFGTPINFLSEFKTFVNMGLLKIKPELLQEILEIQKKLFSPTDRVLGVLLRGTDYVAKRPKGHAIPPPVEFAASTVVTKLQDWKCNKIFLSTEDKNIIQVFKNVFNDACIILDREYVDYKVEEQAISLVRIDRPNDHFIQGRDYLTQIILLSTCNSFVAARCSGSVGAMLMTKGFEHTYFFNLGRYGMITLD